MTGNAEYRATYTQIEKPVYSVVSGSGQIWTKRSSEVAEFTFKRSLNDSEMFRRFVELKVDDVAVAKDGTAGSTNYEIASGSLIVKLASGYLETLSVGEHKIQAVFDDGASEMAALNVVAADEPKGGGDTDGMNGDGLSATGDMLPVGALIVLVAASALIVFVARRRMDETR